MSTQSASISSSHESTRLGVGVLVRSFLLRLFAPIDIAILVYFRIGFGVLMMWEVWRYFDHGWIARYYMTPAFNFPYFGFEWVKPWPGNGMEIHFLALGALAFCIAIGFWYRPAALLFFLGFTYVFLLDETQYLNHFYLISLISFLTIFLPANRALALDVVGSPEKRSDVAPAWTLWLLRFQIGIVYFYGGVAKLNGDWLRGQPMGMWMGNRTGFPVIGPLFTEPWMVYLFSYGGLLLDLLAFPFLLWKRTRLATAVVVVLFHLTNVELFSIGVFPWFMIAVTPLFFDPSWPRLGGLWARRGRKKRSRTSTPIASPSPNRAGTDADAGLSGWQRVTVAGLALYAAAQILVPLRHFVIPGEVSWTEEGHRFAWHMKLRDKDAHARFFATDPATGESWEVDPDDYLTSRQFRKMSSRPYMIHQFAHYLADDLERQGYEDVEIRTNVIASLNGRPAQLLVDPEVDLAAEPIRALPVSWILPLEESRPRPLGEP